MYSLGHVQTNVEKKNERDGFLVFFGETQLERWQEVIQKMVALTDTNQAAYAVSQGRRCMIFERSLSDLKMRMICRAI